MLRRLSHKEYDATVSDLLGLDCTLGASFAPDEVVDGYTNDAEALGIQPLLADQYRAAAEDLAWEVDLDGLLPCDPWTLGQTACAMVFAEDFGFRAFRRPMTEQELDLVHDLFGAVGGATYRVPEYLLNAVIKI